MSYFSRQIAEDFLETFFNQLGRFFLKCLLAIGILFSFTTYSQNVMPSKRAVFKQFSYKTKGRIRAIDVIEGYNKQHILVLDRKDNYPSWQYSLKLLQLNQNQWQEVYSFTVPTEFSYYSSMKLSNEELGVIFWNDKKLLLHKSQKSQWSSYNTLVWQDESLVNNRLNRNSDPRYVPIVQKENNHSEILIYMGQHLKRFKVQGDQIKHQINYQAQFPLYVSSSEHSLPLELKFLSKQSIYHPKITQGSYLKKEALFLSWMDQIHVLSWSDGRALKHYNFNQLSEKERDSGQAVSMISPVDLNADGHMDFILNISLGSPTQMNSRSSVHYGSSDGSVDMKGIKFKSGSDKASGLIAYDLNQDKRYEFVSASGQFNLWSILKALTKRQVDITFSIYDAETKLKQFNKALSEKKLTFGFNLKEFSLAGILPNIKHDFNADGLNDVFYAQNNRKFSVILQKKSKEKYFSSQSAAVYEVNILRNYRLGDFNGDQKTDIILFSTKAKKNKAFVTLINAL